ncbi:CDP-glycerol glycerophosphotransferase family protein [Mammaliicoccus lentus]|uniref:CDP-glycerol glycerophosphotransferase family protein n=1 Tax=Mammaliicoccus lentus TaxID=42858 RepID=UPI003CFA497A
MGYVNKNGNNYTLKHPYSDANGKKVINNNRRMLFKKFYILKDEKVCILENYELEEITIIEEFDNSEKVPGTKVVIYLDPRNRLSFIIIKEHPILSDEKVIEKAESTPAQKLRIYSLKNTIYIVGVLRFRYANMKQINIALGYDKSLSYEHKYFFPKKIRKMLSETTNKLTLLSQLGYTKISKKELLNKYIETSEINLPAYIKSVTPENLNYYYPLKFDYRNEYSKNHYVYSSNSYQLDKGIEYFVRKSISGQIVFVMTDYLKKSIKIKEKISKVLSLFGNKNKYDVYFEKFVQNASESAFEVFKESIAQGDKNSVYILDKENEHFNELQDIYGKNRMIAHNSVKSFYYIFKANKFISSDLVSHIQRRLYDNSSFIKSKILNTDKKIFLQHGVSLATNVFERGYYNKKVPIAPDYIVTNSRYETSYFIEYAKYDRSQLIELGLPNLDLYSRNYDNKKEEITFMLTWRPWDITGNLGEDTYIDRYLQFLNLIISDSFYKGIKVNITLHPKARLLLINQFPDVYDNIKNYIFEGEIKDAVLNSKILITDYSSICYYAFAGGSNIIYFWGDKELAENEYGSPNILQDDNRFGDVVYDIDTKLNECIQRNYNKAQEPFYKSRYKKLVEYTDGNNTEKVYEYIKNLN